MSRPDVIRKEKDFTRIYKKGKSLGDRYVVIFFRKNSEPLTRTAFLASKKVGKSVQRNKAKRRMKEAYREMRETVRPGYDIIIIARNTINDASYHQIKASLHRALTRGKLMKEPERT